MVKKKKQNNKVKFLSLIITILIVIILFFGYNYFFSNKEYHVHADFKVYLDKNPINFSQSKYQSTSTKINHDFVHLHDDNGDVIHYHAKNISLSEFFNSLNMNFTNNCFIDDLNNSYCNNEDSKLRTFVNGIEIQNAPDYVANDLDRILIVYSNRTDFEDLINNVTDEACIQSAKCPERGEPSEGSCITGKVCAIDLNDFS